MDNYVRVKPGLKFPAKISGNVQEEPVSEGEPAEPYDVRFRASWNPERLAYDIDELTVRKLPDGKGITGAGLREIRVQEMFQNSVGWQVRQDNGSLFPPMDAWVLPDNASEAQRLTAAGQIYAISRATGQPALKVVAKTFGISQSTATRLINKARSAGIVD